MGKTIMGVAAVSLDGFIADDNDDVGPLFDWLDGGDASWSLPGSDRAARSSQASADFMTSHYRNMAANVIGRRLFDLTNGWNGTPAAGEHVFVVTHRPPTDWEHFGTAPFTFVDAVEKAIAAAKAFAGDRGRRLGGRSDRQPGARARADRPSGGQPRPGGVRLRSAVLRHRRPLRSRCSWRTRPRSYEATGSPIWSTTSAAEVNSAHAGAVCRRRMQKSPFPQSRSSTETLADARGRATASRAGAANPLSIRLSRSGRFASYGNDA